MIHAIAIFICFRQLCNIQPIATQYVIPRIATNQATASRRAVHMDSDPDFRSPIQMHAYNSILLLVLSYSLAAHSFLFSEVPLDDDDKDRPAASTGHSLVARRNSLWLFGGIIEWHTKQGEKGK